jgi:hypothetical protein
MSAPQIPVNGYSSKTEESKLVPPTFTPDWADEKPAWVRAELIQLCDPDSELHRDLQSQETTLTVMGQQGSSSTYCADVRKQMGVTLTPPYLSGFVELDRDLKMVRDYVGLNHVGITSEIITILRKHLKKVEWDNTDKCKVVIDWRQRSLDGDV